MNQSLRQGSLPICKIVKVIEPSCLIILAGFALLHTITYFMVGTVFLELVQLLAPSNRTALDFYEVYQQMTFVTVLTQLIRGLIMGMVCLPLFRIIFASKRPRLLIIALIWGLGLFASVEPLPGSFEGLLYTLTTPFEHVMALTAVFLQTMIFSAILFKWIVKDRNMRGSIFPEKTEAHVPQAVEALPFIRRFTLLHVATYFIVGALYYQFSNYQYAIETMEMFDLWRTMDNNALGIFIFLGQFIRGMVMAVLLLPFSGVFLKHRAGWKFLFTTIWGITFLSAINIAPWLIQDILSGEAPIDELLIGPPEVTIQMLLFSLTLYGWYQWKKQKTNG